MEEKTKALWQKDGSELLILGVVGSPYSRKVLSACRYQRIQHRFVFRHSKDDEGFPEPPGPPLLPNVIFVQTWNPMADSTFILKEIEKQNLGRSRERSLRPSDPVISLLCSLLEDFADEWLTKCMFHYRWSFGRDSRQAGWLLPSWSGQLAKSEEELRNVGEMVAKRQIDRLDVIGSSPTTKSIIEDSYIRLLRCLDSHLGSGYQFLFGERPSSADFAIFGQLSQLVVIEPTAAELCETMAPRVLAWVGCMEDLSGYTIKPDDWKIKSTEPLPPTLHAFLRDLVGKVYVPYMISNSKAIELKLKEVSFTDQENRKWISTPFKYQHKCVQWLKEEYQTLASKDQLLFQNLIRGTGCEVLFQDEVSKL